ALDSASRGGGEHCQRARDIAFVKSCGRRCADRAGDVNDRVGVVDEPFERVAALKIAEDPVEPVAFALLAAGEGFDLMSGGECYVDQMRADEAGGAGNRQPHRGDQLRSSAASIRSSSAVAARRWMIASSNGSRPSSSGALTG